MFMYPADVVERRRQEPGDDLISRLVAGADPDDPDSLSPIEITLFAVLLLVAGNETTTNLLGNGAAAFAAHPDQAGLLRSRPDLLGPAIEEVLRWDAPVQALFRSTTRPVALAGVRSEEHTSELQSLMRISYAVFCLKKITKHTQTQPYSTHQLHLYT